MSAFKVDKAFWQPRHDTVVLTGSPLGPVFEGMQIDLPKSIKGPGWVPIRAYQQVRFADGSSVPGIVIAHEDVVDAPLMEFSDLVGLTLTIRPAPQSDS